MTRNSNEIHYVKCPNNHIVIDFDSKDGQGLHLNYIADSFSQLKQEDISMTDKMR